jgi:hypothetical protein
MAFIWIELWMLKEKHKHKQIQHLATSKEMICSNWLKKQSKTNEEATKSKFNG